MSLRPILLFFVVLSALILGWNSSSQTSSKSEALKDKNDEWFLTFKGIKILKSQFLKVADRQMTSARRLKILGDENIQFFNKCHVKTMKDDLELLIELDALTTGVNLFSPEFQHQIDEYNGQLVELLTVESYLIKKIQSLTPMSEMDSFFKLVDKGDDQNTSNSGNRQSELTLLFAYNNAHTLEYENYLHHLSDKADIKYFGHENDVEPDFPFMAPKNPNEVVLSVNGQSIDKAYAKKLWEQMQPDPLESGYNPLNLKFFLGIDQNTPAGRKSDSNEISSKLPNSYLKKIARYILAKDEISKTNFIPNSAERRQIEERQIHYFKKRFRELSLKLMLGNKFSATDEEVEVEYREEKAKHEGYLSVQYDSMYFDNLEDLEKARASFKKGQSLESLKSFNSRCRDRNFFGCSTRVKIEKQLARLDEEPETIRELFNVKNTGELVGPTPNADKSTWYFFMPIEAPRDPTRSKEEIRYEMDYRRRFNSTNAYFPELNRHAQSIEVFESDGQVLSESACLTFKSIGAGMAQKFNSFVPKKNKQILMYTVAFFGTLLLTVILSGVTGPFYLSKNTSLSGPHNVKKLGFYLFLVYWSLFCLITALPWLYLSIYLDVYFRFLLMLFVKAGTKGAVRALALTMMIPYLNIGLYQVFVIPIFYLKNRKLLQQRQLVLLGFIISSTIVVLLYLASYNVAYQKAYEFVKQDNIYRKLDF